MAADVHVMAMVAVGVVRLLSQEQMDDWDLTNGDEIPVLGFAMEQGQLMVVWLDDYGTLKTVPAWAVNVHVGAAE